MKSIYVAIDAAFLVSSAAPPRRYERRAAAWDARISGDKRQAGNYGLRAPGDCRRLSVCRDPWRRAPATLQPP